MIVHKNLLLYVHSFSGLDFDNKVERETKKIKLEDVKVSDCLAFSEPSTIQAENIRMLESMALRSGGENGGGFLLRCFSSPNSQTAVESLEPSSAVRPRAQRMVFDVIAQHLCSCFVVGYFP